jgi:hypothetical protein
MFFIDSGILSKRGLQMKKIRTLGICLVLIAAASAINAASLSVHVTVLFQSDKPSLEAFFEEAKLSQKTKDCLFLNLSGDATAEEKAAWQSRLAAVQGMSLQALSVLSQTKQGFRKDEVDSLGRIRRSTWTWGADMVNQVALFDDQGIILRLDRWKNQRSLPDSMVPTFSCGQSYTHPSSSFCSVTQSGLSDGNMFSLGCSVDQAVYNCLIHDLGVSTDVCTPSGKHYTEIVPYPGLGAASQPTVIPTVAPNVVPTAAPTIAPTKVPTVVPTAAPTAVPTMVPVTIHKEVIGTSNSSKPTTK